MYPYNGKNKVQPVYPLDGQLNDTFASYFDCVSLQIIDRCK